MYYIFKSIKGDKSIHTTAETKLEAARIEEHLRKALREVDPTGTEMDCYIRSDAEMHAEAEAAEKWSALTEEQKKETIEVNGKKYIKALYKPKTSKEIRAILGVSRAEFCRRYGIPIRTVEAWDSGANHPSDWVMNLLERVVREDAEASK